MTVTTPLGHVIRDEQGACLEFTRTFPTDVADLWSAITEPSRCARWFGNWTGDPSTGSVQVVMNAEDDNSAQPVTIVECTEAARLVVELPAPEGSWNLAMDLSEADGGSQLVFTQRLAESDDATSIGPGWPTTWTASPPWSPTRPSQATGPTTNSWPASTRPLARRTSRTNRARLQSPERSLDSWSLVATLRHAGWSTK